MKNIKKINFFMNLYMGLTMSFILSLVGTSTGGHFTVVSWLTSFAVSFILSLIIGFIIPINKISIFFTKSLLEKHKFLLKNIIDSLISNILYTPLLSASMVFLARIKIPLEHRPPFITLYIPSLIATFIIGWIVIFIVQPLFLKALLKKYGIKMPTENKPD